jgi:hypothetical protein
MSIPSDAFKNGQGSFSFQMAYAAGQKLLLSMSDATGFGSGGSTNVLVVGASQGGTCDVTGPSEYQFSIRLLVSTHAHSNSSGIPVSAEFCITAVQVSLAQLSLTCIFFSLPCAIRPYTISGYSAAVQPVTFIVS